MTAPQRCLFPVLFILALNACTTVQEDAPAPLQVVIQQPIEPDWGIRSQAGVRYQYKGVPGNLAIFPGTRSSQGALLRALVLGEKRAPGDRIDVRVLGVLEQAGPDGLIETIIATTLDDESLESLEADRSGALAILEAGLVQVEGQENRSLGFRDVRYALRTIRDSRRRYPG